MKVDSVEDFYSQLADGYHQMYGDWRNEVLRQSGILDALIGRYAKAAPCDVLDCTCGIGTQAIGLALKNYRVFATDLAGAAVERARSEAEQFGVEIQFAVADIRSLEEHVSDVFDVVISFDNSLSHLLEDEDLHAAAVQMRRRLKKDGVLFASIRDYDRVVAERRENRAADTRPLPGVVSSNSLIQPTLPRVFDDANGRRVVFQIWDWAEDDRSYAVNHFHMNNHSGKWQTHAFVTRYRALQRSDFTAILQDAGFADIRWLLPEESDYYQPVVVARNP